MDQIENPQLGVVTLKDGSARKKPSMEGLKAYQERRRQIKESKKAQEPLGEVALNTPAGISKRSKKIKKEVLGVVDVARDDVADKEYRSKQRERGKQVSKVISVGEVIPIGDDDPVTRKRFRIFIKYLGRDERVHKKPVTFGLKPTEEVDPETGETRLVYKDYIGHYNEKKRCSTQVRFSNDGYEPTSGNFYRMYLLNNKDTLEASYADMKNVLKTGWGYEDSETV